MYFQLKQFDWVTCSGPDALAYINELELSDPLSIPGNVTITVDSVLSADVTSPLKVSLLLVVHSIQSINLTYLERLL
jgi:ganglioside GM2 activator